MFKTFSEVQTQYWCTIKLWRDKHVWGRHLELWAVPNFGVQLATRQSCGMRWLPSAYRHLPAWLSVIHSWVPRYLKLAARAQDRGTTLEVPYLPLHRGWLFLCVEPVAVLAESLFCYNTLSALSLTHVYLYRCDYWTYSTCPSLHSALRRCRLTIHRSVKHFDFQVSAFWI